MKTLTVSEVNNMNRRSVVTELVARSIIGSRKAAAKYKDLDVLKRMLLAGKPVINPDEDSCTLPDLCKKFNADYESVLERLIGIEQAFHYRYDVLVDLNESSPETQVLKHLCEGNCVEDWDFDLGGIIYKHADNDGVVLINASHEPRYI